MELIHAFVFMGIQTGFKGVWKMGQRVTANVQMDNYFEDQAQNFIQV